MELLCGVPRVSKTSSWNNWVGHGIPGSCKEEKSLRPRLSRSTSARGDEFGKLFGVGSLRSRRVTVTGSIRSTKSAGAAGIYGVTGVNLTDSSRPQSINRHILPSSSVSKLPPSHESYSKPLTVVDSFAEYDEVPLRRSHTLPPSSIKRTSGRGLFSHIEANEQSSKESVSNLVADEIATQVNEKFLNRQYAVPDIKASHTMPIMKRKSNNLTLVMEGPYEISECQKDVCFSTSSDANQIPSENQQWNHLHKSSQLSLLHDATNYEEPVYEYRVTSNTNAINLATSTSDNTSTENYRMCKRHSVASTSSSSACSRLTSLLGEETLYSGSLSEAGSSIVSYSTSIDEGVYSASSITASSVYSSCGRDSSEAEEACLRCQHEAETGVRLPCRRARSVRSARQLPVTPTLRKLLQMGLDQTATYDSKTVHTTSVATKASAVSSTSTTPLPASPTPTQRSSSSNGSATTAIHSHVLPTPPPSTAVQPPAAVVRRERLHPPRTDAHRFSRANLEESGDLELDAILGELCALGSQFEQELSQKNSANITPPIATPLLSSGVNARAPSIGSRSSLQQHKRDSSGKTKFDSLNMDADQPPTTLSRTDSPDNDSAFSDSVSVLSSESSSSSGASHAQRQQRLQNGQPMDHAAQVKAEKIKLALEKIKEANVKKLFLKAFSRDGSSKSLLVDEKMTVAHVTRLLADKNHVTMDPKWTIIEHLPDLYMERVYEDDEMLVENLLLWARDSKNKLFFLDRPDKYALFWQPEDYLTTQGTDQQPLDDEAKNSMIEEFFSSGSVPEMEGPLFLKSEGKKAWKKFYFVLRASGLYYCPKGKSSRSSKDLVCLVTFENNQVYQGIGWRKKHKAPTDCGFAIKPSTLQSKNSKYMKYLCTEEMSTMHRWIMAIRIAKCGRRLLSNYRVLIEDLAQEDIDLLASSRSFSLASVAPPSSQASQATTPSSESRSLDSCLASSVTTSVGDSDRDDVGDSESDGDGATPVNTLNRSHSQWTASGDGESPTSGYNANLFNTLASTTSNSSSSSSGCMSHRSNASTPSTEHGFESEFSQQGTIKRKPAGPKIPLTNTTRHMLHEQEREDDTTDSVSPLSSRICNSSNNNSNTLNMGNLRLSLRRSIADESSNTSTLKRRNSSSSTLPRGFSSKLSGNKCSNTLPHSIHSTLPSMPAPSGQSAEVDGLPLPPPLLEIVQTLDPELLPPPPPELLASTLSLASSLPPPPDELSPPNPDEMSCSMISLPPPPPPLSLPLVSNNNNNFYSTHNNPTQLPPTPPPVSSKPKSPPPPVAPKPRRMSECSSPTLPSPPQPMPLQLRPAILVPPKPAAPKKKKITFRDDVQNIPPVTYSPSPPSPGSPNKPHPPPRSESTRLSLGSPQRQQLNANKLTPPRSFLNNLQKVMQRKWQVAEKCKDFDTNPHEVLGFRDSIPQTETERNVGAWIQEHYGCIFDHLGNNPNASVTGVENDCLPSPPLPSPPAVFPHQAVVTRPVSSMSVQSNISSQSNVSSNSRASQVSCGRRKPPPPPPKRSDTTHLSSASTRQ
uniref:Amyloid beta A4 protein-binding family B member 1-interacting protein isoform X3 n=2 Tax=Hirondellea gigas TaxID=1518452 RepID=A0A6A7FS04_9CRUS